MFRICSDVSNLIGPPSRREFLRVGGLSCLGLTAADLIRAHAVAAPSKRPAKRCIVLFFLGGPPQHSTWDPKPSAPANIRGEFAPISTNVPGLQIASLFPHVAKLADQFCFLRAVSTDDNAHSSSGYTMLTGMPHAPKNAENVNPGAPNDWPNLGSLVRKLRGDPHGIPSAVRLPMHIFNTDHSIWPGQDAGFLGRSADPWLFRCEPHAANFKIPEFSLGSDVSPERFADRRNLLQKLDRGMATLPVSSLQPAQEQAFNVLTSPKARAAFNLNAESDATKEKYGKTPFGQSCLLARRLIEANVSLVQVNWYRGPEEPADAPCWDSHVREADRLKTALAPTADRAIAGLVDDLKQRGMLDDTLVCCLSEFGRSPKINAAAGRDHWGHVFSIALAGGGVRGGMAYGSSDAHGAYPIDGRVSAADLMSTILYSLGIDPHQEIRDSQNRPFAASRGDVVQKILKSA